MAPEKHQVRAGRPAASTGPPTGASSGADPGFFFAGMISAFESLLADAAERLSGEFGPLISMCEAFPFDFTGYYNAEMGSGLMRTYCIFAGPAVEDDLRRSKGVSAALEKELYYPGTGRRRVNIDPGVLTAGHLVLATHKRAAHRISLGEGVYGELELIYVNGAYRPLPWTYRDYKSEIATRFLEGARAALARTVRSTAREPSAARGSRRSDSYP